MTRSIIVLLALIVAAHAQNLARLDVNDLEWIHDHVVKTGKIGSESSVSPYYTASFRTTESAPCGETIVSAFLGDHLLGFESSCFLRLTIPTINPRHKARIRAIIDASTGKVQLVGGQGVIDNNFVAAIAATIADIVELNKRPVRQ